MKKDFDRWNENKKRIQDADFSGYIHEREVWWCALGVNIGFEQDGKNELFERPVLILKKFNKDVVLVIPLSSQEKEGKYYFSVPHEGKTYSGLLSQIRLISTKRLLRKLYRMDSRLFEELRDAVCDVIKSRAPLSRGSQRSHDHL